MLNTRKLLYILPDVAYVAELLPTKKEHTFSIQAFRQINGEFLNEDEFIVENLEKLIGKIEPDEYHVVLPDFLFTNTILEVEESGEAKVQAYVKENILPKLNLTKDEYQISIFALTEHQGKTKTQLSALENSVVMPLSAIASNRHLKISGISPLSWSIKSVVSLEPSITLIQIGGNLYLAQHYIGVDQANQAKVEELDTLAETIKTLKGGEPSLQTVYLLTNELVADNLKQMISNILPIQQLATFKEDETQMPSYLKQTIEAGMKTLDIPEYHAPSFELPPADDAALAKVAATTPATTANDTQIDSEVESAAKPEVEDETESTIEDDSDDVDSDTAVDSDSAKLPEADETLELPEPHTPLLPPAIPTVTADADVTPDSDVELPEPKLSELPTASEPELSTSKQSVEPDLAQFAAHTDSDSSDVKSETATTEIASQVESLDDEASKTDRIETDDSSMADAKTSSEPSSSHEPESDDTSESEKKPAMPTATPAAPVTPIKPVIKNKAGGSSFFKMVLLTLAVFVATVVVGVGIGLGFLKFAGGGFMSKPATSPSPSPVSSAQPTPSPVATASPAAQLNKASDQILVVNATTIAGYAGKTKKALETDGFKKVSAGNAKGEYEPGTYVLMKTEDAAAIAELEKATELDLTFQNTISTEDPKGEYKAIIVLAK